MDRPKIYRRRRPKKVVEKSSEDEEDKKKPPPPPPPPPTTCDKGVQASSIMVLIPFNLLKNVPVEVMKKHSALYNREIVKAEDTVTTKHLPIAPAPTRRDSVAVAATSTAKVTSIQELDIQTILDMIQNLPKEKIRHLKEYLKKSQKADYIPTYVIDSDSDVEIITEAYKSSETNKKTIADRLEAMKIELDVKRDPETETMETESDASENKRKTKERAESQLSHLPPKLRCKSARVESSSSSSESSSSSSSSSDEASVNSSRSPAYSPLTALLESPRSCVTSSSASVSPAGSCVGSPRAPVPPPAGSCAGSPRAPVPPPAGSCAGSPRAPVSPARSCTGSPRPPVSSAESCARSPRAPASHSPQLLDESTLASTWVPTMFGDEQNSHPPRPQSPQQRSPPRAQPLPYKLCSTAASPASTGHNMMPVVRLLDFRFRRSSVPACRPPPNISQSYSSKSPNLSVLKPPLAHQLLDSTLLKHLQTTNHPSSTSPQADNLCMRKLPSNNPPMDPGLVHQPTPKNMPSKYMPMRTTNQPMSYSQANKPSDTSIAMNVPNDYPFNFAHPDRHESFQHPVTPAHNVHQRQQNRYNLRRASVDCKDEFRNDLYTPTDSQMRDSGTVVNRIFNPNMPRQTQEPQRPPPCTSIPPPTHVPYCQHIRAARMGPMNMGQSNMGPMNMGPINTCPMKMGQANFGPPRYMVPPNMRHVIPQPNIFGGHTRQIPPPPPPSPFYTPRDM